MGFLSRTVLFICLALFFWVLGSLQASLLCLVGELAGEGSVAVAIGIIYIGIIVIRDM